MTLPAYILGFIIASLFGVVFHIIRGGGGGKLLLYLILGWLGFWGGHFLADILNWSFIKLGPLNLGLASAGSILALGLGYWLSLVEKPKDKEKRGAASHRTSDH